jgi:PilZ domain
MTKLSLVSTDSGEERRNERRRRVLFFGKVADATGAEVAECAISNLSAIGAQLRLYGDYAPPSQVYLIDAKTHSAHLSEVIWHRGDRLGLSFRTTFDLEKEIPERLHFLKTLLIATKLRQVELLEGKGFSLDEALEAIGATRTAYERWRREHLLHEETRTTIDRLVVENTNLLKTLAAQANE